MAEDPNRRCTCGFRKFRSGRTSTSEDVLRWMLFEDEDGGEGLGATPFGTFFGSGDGTLWGEFPSTLRATTETVVCKSCQRIRINKRLGGAAVFGSYIENGYIYVVVSDAERPFTCFEIRIDGPGGFTYTASLKRVVGAPPAIVATAPPNTAESPPAGAATVDTLLRARLPAVPVTGTYTFTFVDRCAVVETTLVAVVLEEAPMIIVPQDADLNGAPSLWLQRTDMERPTQYGTKSIHAIPFEYCSGVIEYDARFGIRPENDGWTHTATLAGAESDYQLIEGGVLRLQGNAGSQSYWTKTLAFASLPSPLYVHAYSRFFWASNDTSDGRGTVSTSWGRSSRTAPRKRSFGTTTGTRQTAADCTPRPSTPLPTSFSTPSRTSARNRATSGDGMKWARPLEGTRRPSAGTCS